ncbi:MAG: hypothetical protein OXC07_08160 [Kistimonas sp.]|nr:hypothetical protein [Kistimonas sp.]
MQLLVPNLAAKQIETLSQNWRQRHPLPGKQGNTKKINDLIGSVNKLTKSISEIHNKPADFLTTQEVTRAVGKLVAKLEKCEKKASRFSCSSVGAPVFMKAYQKGKINEINSALEEIRTEHKALWSKYLQEAKSIEESDVSNKKSAFDQLTQIHPEEEFSGNKEKLRKLSLDANDIRLAERIKTLIADSQKADFQKDVFNYHRVLRQLAEDCEENKSSLRKLALITNYKDENHESKFSLFSRGAIRNPRDAIEYIGKELTDKSKKAAYENVINLHMKACEESNARMKKAFDDHMKFIKKSTFGNSRGVVEEFGCQLQNAQENLDAAIAHRTYATQSIDALQELVGEMIENKNRISRDIALCQNENEQIEKEHISGRKEELEEREKQGNVTQETREAVEEHIQWYQEFLDDKQVEIEDLQREEKEHIEKINQWTRVVHEMVEMQEREESELANIQKAIRELQDSTNEEVIEQSTIRELQDSTDDEELSDLRINRELGIETTRL